MWCDVSFICSIHGLTNLKLGSLFVLWWLILLNPFITVHTMLDGHQWTDWIQTMIMERLIINSHLLMTTHHMHPDGLNYFDLKNNRFNQYFKWSWHYLTPIVWSKLDPDPDILDPLVYLSFLSMLEMNTVSITLHILLFLWLDIPVHHEAWLTNWFIQFYFRKFDCISPST